MLRIALTGGIACGKSQVGHFLEKQGVPVCEADHLAHEAIEPGQPAYAEVVASFGTSILASDGSVERARLGEIVFADAGARARLNAIVHPRVQSAWDVWLDQQAARGCDMAVVIVPLLFEANVHHGWDVIVCVRASVDIQAGRLAGRGLDVEQAQQRINAQLAVEDKARRSDYVIDNDGTLKALEGQTVDLVRRLRESKHGRTR